MEDIDKLINDFFKNWADAGGWECNIIMSNGDYAQEKDIENVARYFFKLGRDYEANKINQLK